MKISVIFLFCLLCSGCAIRRKVQIYNDRVYTECVKKHNGDSWKWNGLELTCKPLNYPACEQTLIGQECHN